MNAKGPVRPHCWRALVGDVGFPGVPSSGECMMSSAWRVVYLWGVNACAVIRFLLALAPRTPEAAVAKQWIPHAAAWIACEAA